MKISIEVEVPGAVSTPEHIAGLERHVRASAEQAAQDFADNEVNPDGCWCTGLAHQEKCRHHTIPY